MEDEMPRHFSKDRARLPNTDVFLNVSKAAHMALNVEDAAKLIGLKPDEFRAIAASRGINLESVFEKNRANGVRTDLTVNVVQIEKVRRNIESEVMNYEPTAEEKADYLDKLMEELPKHYTIDSLSEALQKKPRSIITFGRHKQINVLETLNENLRNVVSEKYQSGIHQAKLIAEQIKADAHDVRKAMKVMELREERINPELLRECIASSYTIREVVKKTGADYETVSKATKEVLGMNLKEAVMQNLIRDVTSDYKEGLKLEKIVAKRKLSSQLVGRIVKMLKDGQKTEEYNANTEKIRKATYELAKYISPKEISDIFEIDYQDAFRFSQGVKAKIKWREGYAPSYSEALEIAEYQKTHRSADSKKIAHKFGTSPKKIEYLLKRISALKETTKQIKAVLKTNGLESKL